MSQITMSSTYESNWLVKLLWKYIWVVEYMSQIIMSSTSTYESNYHMYIWVVHMSQIIWVVHTSQITMSSTYESNK